MQVYLADQTSGGNGRRWNKKCTGVLTLIKDNVKGADPAYAGLGDRLSTIAAPIILIASKTDQIVGSPNPSAFPDGTTSVWIEEVGHMPHLEKSGDVSTALKELA